MNKIMQILEALKQECKKLENIEGQISIEKTAEIMKISKHTLQNSIDRAKVPYPSIIEFCNRENINTDDIFFADIKRTCSLCPNELEGENISWYKTRQKNEDGTAKMQMRRQCRTCYNKMRKESMRKAYLTRKKNHE